MADTKISALPASTVPLAGTEVLPIVQSSTTKQVSVANLTAGRAISATQITLTTGNVIVASGQGIDFSATAGTGTSELLADYEEGTFTPTAIGGTTAGVTVYTTQNGNYTKVGNVVTVWGEVTVLTATGTGNLRLGGFPYTASSSGAPNVGSVQTNGLAWSQSPSSSSLYVNQNAAYAVIYNSVDNGGWGVTAVENGAWSVYYTISYRV